MEEIRKIWQEMKQLKRYHETGDGALYDDKLEEKYEEVETLFGHERTLSKAIIYYLKPPMRECCDEMAEPPTDEQLKKLPEHKCDVICRHTKKHISEPKTEECEHVWQEGNSNCLSCGKSRVTYSEPKTKECCGEKECEEYPLQDSPFYTGLRRGKEMKEKPEPKTNWEEEFRDIHGVDGFDDDADMYLEYFRKILKSQREEAYEEGRENAIIEYEEDEKTCRRDISAFEQGKSQLLSDIEKWIENEREKLNKGKGPWTDKYILIENFLKFLDSLK